MKPLKLSLIYTYLLFSNSFADDSYYEDFIGNPVSIIFIADQSASMWDPPLSPLDPQPNDRWGARFTASRALIETIFEINLENQIGLVIFGNYLFFDTTDDQLFKKCPAENRGAYIPLLTLNETYNGKTGSDIINYYLETDTVTNFFDDEYVDLVHQPTDNGLQTENNSMTNIYAGFEAAKLAMTESPYPKEDHYVIFFSDGEATVPDIDSLKYFYVKGENVPTTFTIYFTPDNQSLENLETMTANIKNNGYSSSNQLANLWTTQADHDSLYKLLMDSVITKIFDPTFIAWSNDNYTNKNFVFINSHNGKTIINYTVNENSNIILDIYNLHGRKVRSLVNGYKKAGSHQAVWERSGMQCGNGCYLIRLVSDKQKITKSFILAR